MQTIQAGIHSLSDDVMKPGPIRLCKAVARFHWAEVLDDIAVFVGQLHLMESL